MTTNNQNLSVHETSEEEMFYKLQKKVLCYLGSNSDGNKKPKVCWNYVKNDKCNHLQHIPNEPQIIANLWHPEINEKNYLKNKNMNKRF